MCIVDDDFFGEILPPECALSIFSHLAPIDIANASQVSKVFFNLIDSRGIWKKAVEHQFGEIAKDLRQQKIFKINWRVTFNHANTVLKWVRYFNSPKFHPLTIPDKEAPVSSKSGRCCQPGPDYTYIIYANEKRKSVVGKIFSLNPYFDKMIGFSDNVAVFRFELDRSAMVYNMTMKCKHVDEQKWKSSSNALEPCKEQCARTKITNCAHHYWHKLSETALLLTEQELLAVNKSTGAFEKTSIDFKQLRLQNDNWLHGRGNGRSILEARNMTRNGKTSLIAVVHFESGYIVVNVTEQKILRTLIGQKIAWFTKSSNVAVLRESTVHVTDFMDPTATLLKVADVKKFPGAKSIEDIVAPREGEYALILALLFNNRSSLVTLIWPIGLALGDFSMDDANLLGEMNFSSSDPSLLVCHKHIGLKYSQPLRFT